MLLLQPISGQSADVIVKECPGLFEIEGSGKSRQAKVNAAREHTQLLEKVCAVHKVPCCLLLNEVHELLLGCLPKF